MAVVTKGTQAWMVFPGTTPSVVAIGCPTGLTGLGGAKTQIPTTCLDSQENEFIGGMAQPGQVTINLDFDPTKISHQDLWDLNESGVTVQWVVGFSDGSAAPTLSSAGVLTFPSTRTYVDFEGYVADLPLDFAINSVVKSTMQVQRSGARTLHTKA